VRSSSMKVMEAIAYTAIQKGSDCVYAAENQLLELELGLWLRDGVRVMLPRNSNSNARDCICHVSIGGQSHWGLDFIFA